MVDPAGIGFEGNNAGASLHEGGADRTVAGAYIQYQVARMDAGLRDEALRPLLVEFVPSPPSWCRLHGPGRS
jgi:hypothetical protein